MNGPGQLDIAAVVTAAFVLAMVTAVLLLPAINEYLARRGLGEHFGEMHLKTGDFVVRVLVSLLGTGGTGTAIAWRLAGADPSLVSYFVLTAFGTFGVSLGAWLLWRWSLGRPSLITVTHLSRFVSPFSWLLARVSRYLNPFFWLRYALDLLLRVTRVRRLLDLAGEARLERERQERNVAHALGSDTSTFVLSKLGESSSMAVNDLASIFDSAKIDSTYGWIAVIRLVKAGLIDEIGGSLYVTPSGRQHLEELLFILRNARGMS